ncbi:D-methionine ABC transporter, ATP-binding protein [compost metagenome]
MITHQMEVIKQVCDRVAVLEAGEVVEQGRVIDVFLRPQHDVTRAMIGDVISQELPASVLKRVESRLGNGRDHVYRLAFTGEGVDQPVLAQAIRRYGLDFNILHGHIDEIQGQAFGSLAIMATGELADVKAAMEYLQAQGVVVEEFEHVVVLLHLTNRGGVLSHPLFNRTIGVVVNAVRSIPFIILLVVVIPFTRFIVGSSIGTTAAIVPLTIAAIPFIARLVESALREVDKGLVEAAQSMGATTGQIVWKVLLPEAMPGIVAGLTITFVSLVGYSAMAGAIGGGGLGDLGIRYGYQRYITEVMVAVVVILIIFVQAVQSFGDWLVRRISHR